ncbi:MAG: aspartate aminotransferase family protein [Candidatus Saliniplasma sp.]
MEEDWKVEIVTDEVPGPKSKEIIERKKKCVPDGIALSHEIVTEEAKGSYIRDVDGNTFIDFGGGIAVINAGHSNPTIVRAIKKQAEKFTHTQAYKVPYENYIELAEKMIKITPIKGKEAKCYFANSGAEAVENAVRVARNYKAAPKVIRFENSFHGRTSLTMGLTANNLYKKGSFANDSFLYRAPFPDYRNFPGTKDECIDYCLDKLKYLIEIECSPEETAAVIIEPVQGEGGYIPVPERFMKEMRELLEKNDIALIIDEIQSGVGRTGAFWAFEQYDIKPDLVTFGKAIANGLPLSGVVGRKDILDSVNPGGIGGTFGGNPVACSAALATIDEIKDNLDNVVEVGEKMYERLNELKEEYDVIDDVRGIGPMIGIEFVNEAGEPNAKIVKDLLKEARENGLILLKSGPYGHVIRICGPVTSSLDVINKGLDLFEDALEACVE